MRERARHIVIAGAALLALLAAGGCYERTIKSSGFGYDRKVIQKPLAPQGGVDDLIFGQPEVKKVDEEAQPRGDSQVKKP